MNNSNKLIVSNLIISAVGSAAAEIATLPICTVKTNYQNQRLSDCISITNITKRIYANGGLGAFYRASFAAVSSQALSTSSKYALYRILEENQVLSNNKFVNGALSGIISSLFTHPLDTVKIHNQMLQSDNSFDKKHTYLSELKKNGVGLLYRGYSKTVGKVSLGSMLFFPLYDTYYKLSNNNCILASFGSALTSTIIIQPLDYLKTRHIYGQSLYEGGFKNLSSYYKGLSLNLMRIIPHFMITMVMIEYLKVKY